MTEDAYVRLAVLEEQLKALIESQNKRDEKLDELLALKQKGLGAIWLATLIIGTGLASFITTIAHWIDG